MLGNSDEGTRKMWTYKAKYSGWGKLQPSPLWRVKVTRRKRSILDVAFLEFKDFTNKYLWKACVTLALVEMHQLRPFIHTSKHYWEAATLICITSHKYKHQGAESSGNICWYLGGVGIPGLDPGQSVAIRGIKAWTGQSGHTADIIAAHSTHCSPADTRRCSHNSGHTITSIGVRRREEAAANISGMLRLIPDM